MLFTAWKAATDNPLVSIARDASMAGCKGVRLSFLSVLVHASVEEELVLTLLLRLRRRGLLRYQSLSEDETEGLCDGCWLSGLADLFSKSQGLIELELMEDMIS